MVYTRPMSDTTPSDRFSPRALLRRFTDPPPLVSVVRLSGVIAEGGGLRPGLSLAAYAGVLARAFHPRKQAAVALAINSPGGSPVQSALLAARIRALAGEKNVPVLAFIEDVGASGGYWLACAADEIHAEDSSIVGSIGVISASFGLSDFITRHGIERRLFTAGERKSLLDPFRPLRDEDVARLRGVQTEIHENFKAMVRARRAGRLNAPESELFSGEFWTGRRALELGLIDGIGDLRGVLRRRFGERVRLRVVTRERGWLRRMPRPLTLDETAAAGWGEAGRGLLAAVEERALWARYGL